MVVVHLAPSPAFLGHEHSSLSGSSVVPCDPEACGPHGSKASPNVQRLEDRSELKF